MYCDRKLHYLLFSVRDTTCAELFGVLLRLGPDFTTNTAHAEDLLYSANTIPLPQNTTHSKISRKV